ncbi:MAG TPA: TonB-dependent receptor [Thermoanaerobaculia bacterium]|jgi:iron complex outermembrane receptor protein|nr:TonB-dependent receptor [Thermoanaerobaculia bacterium]
MHCASFRNGARSFARLGLIVLVLLAAGRAGARAQSPTPAPTPQPTPAPVNETVIVSATRGPETELEIPGEATVVTGEQLRQRGVTNLADGIQDLMGIDTGMGSDNGPRQPNVGIWGLKEFDALLFMVDGVPVGGPFLPQLAQIDINDIDRIEVVKGPQGTLYGASAFAGMVQVFTKSGQAGTYVSLAGGSFNEGRVTATTTIPIGKSTLKVFGDFDKLTDGWQPNTDYKDSRGGLRLDVPLDGGGSLSFGYNMFLNQQGFGSPLPVDPPTGTVLPGFRADANYEPIGARVDHRVYALTASATIPINKSTSIQNVLGLTKDDATIAQSFLSGIDQIDQNIGTSTGFNIKPNENDLYDDLHIITNFQAAGSHRLVGGAAITTGKIESSGSTFDFDFQIDPVIVPNLTDIPRTGFSTLTDKRTFFGLYLNDQWTPVSFLTISAGARYDMTSETESVVSTDEGASTASKNADQWSGGGSIVGRVVSGQAGILNDLNLYFAGKTNFKPAAPDLHVLSAEILSPERTTSEEFGVKTNWLDDQVSFNMSFFHMIFNNLVVSILGPDGQPKLVNAGKELFQGAEFELQYRPKQLPYFGFVGGYAHHDALYKVFTFIDPDAGPQDASGQRLELTPRDLWNLGLSYGPPEGLGGWFAIRHQNHRPYDKINIAYMPSYFEYDVGLSYTIGPARLSIIGRNLGDSRHIVGESELGDAQDYIAFPRRVWGEVAFRF